MAVMPFLFGTRLKESRERKGLSQNRLALLSGANQGDISKWEAGVEGRAPNSDTLAKMAPVLDVPLAELQAWVDADALGFTRLEAARLEALANDPEAMALQALEPGFYLIGIPDKGPWLAVPEAAGEPGAQRRAALVVFSGPEVAHHFVEALGFQHYKPQLFRKGEIGMVVKAAKKLGLGWWVFDPPGAEVNGATFSPIDDLGYWLGR